MTDSKTSQKSGPNVSTIIALIVGVLATILVVQNSSEVVINLWFWKLKTSLIILLGITIGLGMLITFLLMIGNQRALKKENRRLRKSMKEAMQSSERAKTGGSKTR